MKIGPFEVRSPFYREAVLDPGAKSSTGALNLFKTPAAKIYKVTDAVSQYDLYEKHDLVRGMIDDLAEAACGQGYYTTVTKESPKLKKNANRDLINKLGEIQNFDEMFPKIAKNALISGFCPVETKLVSDPDKCSFKIVHPKTVDQIAVDPFYGEVLAVHQKVGDKSNTINKDNLAWFSYGNLANDPRGLSFIQSIGEILGILDDTTGIIKEITARYLAPISIWKSRKPSEALRKAVEAKGDGDAIFLGNMTPEEMQQKTVEFVQVDPRVPFWEFMENLQVRIYSYSRASNLWMTKNANLASAEKLEDIVARHVNAIQRNIKRSAERYWVKPMIKLADGDLEDLPRLNFGKEPTGVGDIEPSVIITAGMNLGYISQTQFAAICKQMGLKLPEPEPDEEVAAPVNPKEENPGKEDQNQPDKNAKEEDKQVEEKSPTKGFKNTSSS